MLHKVPQYQKASGVRFLADRNSGQRRMCTSRVTWDSDTSRDSRVEPAISVPVENFTRPDEARGKRVMSCRPIPAGISRSANLLSHAFLQIIPDSREIIISIFFCFFSTPDGV